MAPPPADHLHVVPSFDGVMAKHAPAGLRNRGMGPHPAIGTEQNPLAVSSWVFIAESHQQLFVTVH